MTSRVDRLIDAASDALEAATVAANHPTRLAAAEAIARVHELGEGEGRFPAAKEAMRLSQAAVGAD